MNYLKIMLVAILSTTVGAFSSCSSNTSANTDLQKPAAPNAAPIDSAVAPATNGEASGEQEDEGGDDKKNGKTTSTVAPETQNVKNLFDAYKGETTASAKYAAYSKKAEAEGYHQIALLFKATSTAEKIHAANHKAVLEEAGQVVAAITPEFTVKSTKENLQDALAGEVYEIGTMYPEFMTTANNANNQLALVSLNYAYKTEMKHKVLYEKAIAALQNNTVKSLSSIYYVCSTCGNTYESKAPARCGISMTSAEKFIKVNAL